MRRPVARHRQQADFADVPLEVLAFDPEIHGARDQGIREWKRLALSWLEQNPGRRLPCGLWLDVLRETTRLLQDEWFGQQRD
jgi:hypothetical protein